MAENEESTNTPAAAPEKRSFADAVTDYLSAARKKRKSFVLFALGEMFDEELAAGLEGYIKTNYPVMSVALPKNEAELRRMFNRNITLLVVDDEFMPIDQLLQVVLAIKQRRQEAVVPVLFLTRHAENLVNSYQKVLSAFHESDEYVEYKGTASAEIMARLKYALESQNRRRSRRYVMDLDIVYENLSRKGTHKGVLVDLSIHGALIRAAEPTVFKIGEQIKMQIPTGEVLREDVGEFFRIAGRVKRVFINGDEAGLSFDYISEKQLYLLTKFVTSHVSRQVAHQAVMTTIRKPVK